VSDIYVPQPHPRQPRGLEEKVDQVMQDVAYMRGSFDELVKTVKVHDTKLEEHDRVVAKANLMGRVGLGGLPVLGAVMLAFWKGELRW
jgi:hypothetical protein